MKKLTILDIEAVVSNACPNLIARIRYLEKQMKDCRVMIRRTKKVLEVEIQHFNDYVNDYAKYIAGKALQDSNLLKYTKNRMGFS